MCQSKDEQVQTREMCSKFQGTTREEEGNSVAPESVVVVSHAPPVLLCRWPSKMGQKMILATAFLPQPYVDSDLFVKHARSQGEWKVTYCRAIQSQPSARQRSSAGCSVTSSQVASRSHASHGPALAA